MFRAGALVIAIVLIGWHWEYFSNWFSRITHVEALGVSFDLSVAENNVDALIEQRKSAYPNLPPPSLPFAQAALARAARVLPALTGAQVLWVDSHPDNNALEIQVLRNLGITVKVAVSTQQALNDLQSQAFDLVISNMRRPGDTQVPLKACPALYSDFPDEDLRAEYAGNLQKFNENEQMRPAAGLSMAEVFATYNPIEFGNHQQPKIIFYTASNGGILIDSCARLVTNRPDILLQSVISALEEIRWTTLVDPGNTQ
jgi:CheY-like chemotaxis protein